jgi:hypothetical protein
MGWMSRDLNVDSGGAPAIAPATRVASHVVAAERTHHVFYRTATGHIVEVWWRPGERPRWGDLTVASRGAPLADGDPASHVFVAEGTQHVFYRTDDGALVELWWRGGERPHWGALTGAGAAPKAVGSPVSHVFADEGTQHVFYRAAGGQIIELWWQGGAAAQPENLMVDARGAPPAGSDPVSHVFAPEGTQHVFYTSIDGEVIEIWWPRGGGKGHVDLNGRSPGSPRAAGRPSSHVFGPDATQHVFYVSVDDSLAELRWFGEPSPWRDLLSGHSGSDLPASNPISHTFPARGNQHVFYAGTDLDVRHLELAGDLTPSLQNLAVASGGAPRAVGELTSHLFADDGSHHVFYPTSNDHVQELHTGP